MLHQRLAEIDDKPLLVKLTMKLKGKWFAVVEKLLNYSIICLREIPWSTYE